MDIFDQYNSNEWVPFLEGKFNALLKLNPIPFKTINTSSLPKEKGVYLITENIEPEIYLYIGRTKNLYRRLYTNHLMGNNKNAMLKNYIIKDKGLSEIQAKDYIKENCFVRYILHEDFKIRGALESYFTAMLFPKYGISEEH